MKTVDILVAARVAVADSWTQDSFMFNGAVCAAGGIGAAFGVKSGCPPMNAFDIEVNGLAKGDLLASRTALKYLAHAIGKHCVGGISRAPYNSTSTNSTNRNLSVITAWNDADERTKEEVLAAFDKAIKMAARRHVRG